MPEDNCAASLKRASLKRAVDCDVPSEEDRSGSASRVDDGLEGAVLLDGGANCNSGTPLAV